MPQGANGGPFPANCRENHFFYAEFTGVFHLIKSINVTAAIENIADAKPPF